MALWLVAAPAIAQPRAVVPSESASEASEAAEASVTEPTLEERVEALERGHSLSVRVAELEAERDALAARVEALEAEREDPVPSFSIEDLRPIASFWTRGELRAGYEALEAPGLGCVPFDHGCVRYRARVGVDAGPIRLGGPLRLRFRFSPQAYGAWSTGFTHPEVGLFEGFVALGLDIAELTVGRFTMSYGDQSVIGGADWGPAGRAFDGARLRLGGEGSAWLDVFFTLRLDGLDGVTDSDAYFYGAYGNLGPLLGEGVEVEGYVLADQRNGGLDANGDMQPFELTVTLGSRVVVRRDWFEMRAEGATQPRANGGVGGFLDAQLDFDVGTELQVYVGGAWASERYDQLYPTGHAKLGLTDVIGPRRNVAAGRVGLRWRIVRQVRVLADVHAFGRHSGEVRGYAGSELDLQAIWTPVDGVRLRVLGALFAPGPIYATDQPAWYGELQLGYRIP